MAVGLDPLNGARIPNPGTARCVVLHLMEFMKHFPALRAWALALVAVSTAATAWGQGPRKNLASFDTKPYHFGFLLSANSSDFRMTLRQDSLFADSLLSVANLPQSGFNLALLASWDINGNVHLRFAPGLSFQDRGLEYTFLREEEDLTKVRRTESVYLDFPFLVKLRTDRIGNFAAYGLVGGTLSRDMQSNAEVDQELASDLVLRLEKGNRSLDVGAGVDLFLPFFKFGIEGKFQFGRRDVLIHDDTIYARPLEQLKTRTFILSLCFEG